MGSAGQSNDLEKVSGPGISGHLEVKWPGMEERNPSFANRIEMAEHLCLNHLYNAYHPYDFLFSPPPKQKDEL